MWLCESQPKEVSLSGLLTLSHNLHGSMKLQKNFEFDVDGRAIKLERLDD